MSNAIRSLALAAVAAFVVAQTAGPASAEDLDLDRPGTGSTPGGQGPLSPSKVIAGYAGPGGDEGIQATFTVPDHTCGGEETSSLLSGLLANLTDSEGGGPTLVNGGGGVFFVCVAGTPSVRSALYDPSGRPADAGPVSVGDKIRVTYASDPSAMTASSTLENLTQDFVTITGPFEYFKTTDLQVGDLALAFDGTSGGPVPKVDRTELKQVKIDGKKIKKKKSRLTRYDLVDDSGNPIRTTSKIKKGGFSVRPA